MNRRSAKDQHPPKSGHPTRRITLLVIPPIEELDLIGPVQTLSTANRIIGKQVYTFQVVSNRRELRFFGESGLSLGADGYYQDVKEEFDSLLLVCGVETRHEHDTRLLEWLRTTALRVRRMGAVCVGSFLFARAGLLNGKRATAHWKFGEELARLYPRVVVEPDPIWVKDGNIYTSAGISAGMDLALAWVEEDFGSAIAHQVARELVLFVRRPAGQTQVSAALQSQAAERKSIQELQVWIAENLRRKLSVDLLADRVAMSPRNFERVFLRELGVTPSRYLQQLRLEAARNQLERTDRSLDQIAAGCGFGNADAMRRAFRRILGVTPTNYRKQ
jgi:transcriptional regulator GlxA family with amidase domain